MIAIIAQDVMDDVRRILNDAGKVDFTDLQIIANMKMAERKLKQDRPSASYTTPVAFNEGVTLSPSGTGGVLSTGDTIQVDVFYRDAISHYTAFLCFGQPTRDTVNTEFANRELKLYLEMI